MLKEHNQEAYEAIKKMLKAYKECCIVAATGIGKSNIITELLRDLQLNAMIIVPNKSLENEWNKIYEKYNTEYFSIVTYQYFKLHYKDLYGFDAYIFDEAHHMGAKEWGKAIKNFKSGLIDELFIGATADDNRYFDNDIKAVTNTFFNSDHIVYGLDQEEAIKEGVLPKAKYICAIYNIEEVFAKYKEIKLSDELRGRLNYTMHNCKSIESILQENISTDSYVKGIVFVDTVKNINIGIELVKKAFPNEPVYFIYSKLGRDNNERTLNEFRAVKSGFIISVNMLNEGNHIEGVNTVIMLRKTNSPSLYTQQIGRCLAANCDNAIIFDFVRNDTSIKNILSRLNNASKILNINKKDMASNGYKISNQFIIKDYATDILEVLEIINSIVTKYSRWSETEIEILKKHYPEMGGDVCKLLPGRSRYTCTSMANSLGIYYTKFTNNKLWTSEEIEILKKHYPEMGGDVCKLLPNKDKKICMNKANKLNIKHVTYIPNKWTNEEIEILKKHYPEIGSNVCELLANKDRKACRRKARKLGIYLNNSIIKWDKNEDDIIIKYYPEMGGDVCKLLPGRSKCACISRASKLNILYDNHKWTNEEIEILKKHYPEMGGDVCKLLPGRSRGTCVARAQLLGIKLSRSWTNEEIEILKKNYPKIGMKVCELLPNKSKASCKYKISSLGLEYTG